ncbi:hypothetical protein K435DRAFT_655405 [Dendrothele bispora CBS 962.96]|uniref:Uncharacterized protein n=1 Tax=Dendrothele bispora (strain CBS 962.96) TaxID=1314807 RepID=A0A4S8MFR4_DENBC|nr:hypothetical protein K435DRAFT_655405 [Dendrothele bispora CBS 962.96]
MSISSSCSPPAPTADPFVLYSRSLHDYTLRLWSESRKLAQERSRTRSKELALKQSSMSSRKGESRQRT